MKPFTQANCSHLPLLRFMPAAILSLLCCLSAGTAIAARPLSQLVDQKAGLYLEATQLDQHLQQFLQSQLVTRFRQTDVFQNWLRSKDVHNLKQGLEQLETLTQRPLIPLLRDLFGESVGLAIFNNGPEQNPSVILLTDVKDPQATRSLFEDWFQKTGVTVTKTEYLQTACFTASQQSSNPEKSSPGIHYCFLDQTLIVSESESLLHSSVALHVKPQRGEPLAEQPCLYNLKMYQRARAVLAADVTGYAFLNPRAWDEHIKPPRNEVEQGIVNWWQKTGALIAGLHLKNTLALETVILFNSEVIDLPLLNILQTSENIPDPYTLIPQKALAVMAGQLNVQLLTRKFVEFYAEKHPEKWKKIHAASIGLLGGLDPITDLASTLGPNVLFYSVPRKQLSFDAISFDGLIAMQLSTPDSPPQQTNKTSYQLGMENVANFLLNSVLVQHNTNSKQVEQPAVIKVEEHDLYHLRWIDHLGPYQPAYGINEQQLVLASSPDLVREFFTLKSENSLAALPLFQSWKETFFQEEKQLCFLNISSIRSFIEQNADFLAEQLSRQQGGDPARGKSKLAGLKSLLESFDGVFLAAGLQKTQVRIVIGLGSLTPAR
ncbi:hypothetical protein Pan153_26320 [Gimesia panareensis]|uniref:DUF3352 domain-containing protein n=1 Tax=Gimesia panareensis TaxID=2527978 RepID=A0A518FNN5_9PLAN|nr:hypothetical protein [Gimesia panareensis]QDV17976.1 hypothetical protein Pan153_26320 [Gimesia panareensis]